MLEGTQQESYRVEHEQRPIMKTIQASDYLTLELWPPSPASLLVLRSKGGQP